MASREAELGRLRERAHRLWEGQAAGKGFVHRVSQLSAQYLALSNLTKVTLLPPCNLTTLFLVPSLYLCSRNATACWAVPCYGLNYEAYTPALLLTVVLSYLLCHALFPSCVSVMVSVFSLSWLKTLLPKRVSVSIFSNLPEHNNLLTVIFHLQKVIAVAASSTWKRPRLLSSPFIQCWGMSAFECLTFLKLSLYWSHS